MSIIISQSWYLAMMLFMKWKLCIITLFHYYVSVSFFTSPKRWWLHFHFCTNVQRKRLPGPVPDHTRKHQQKLRQLQHQPQITVHESEPVLHPQPPGQHCYPLFTQHRFEDYEVIVILIGVSQRLQSSSYCVYSMKRYICMTYKSSF